MLDAEQTEKNKSTSDAETPDQIGAIVHSLSAAIAERSRAEQELQSQYPEGSHDPESGLSLRLASIDTRFEADRAALQGDYEAEHNNVLNQCAEEYSTVHGEYGKVLADIERQFELERQAIEREKADARWMVSSMLDDESRDSPKVQLDVLQRGVAATSERLQAQRRAMEQTFDSAVEVMRRRRQWQEFEDAEAVTPPKDLGDAEERFDAACRSIHDGYHRLVRQKLSRAFIGWRPAMLFVLAIFAFFPIVYFIGHAIPRTAASANTAGWLAAVSAVSAVLAATATFILFETARTRSSAVFAEVQQSLAEMKTTHQRWREFAQEELRVAKQQLEQRHQELIARRDRSLATIDAKAVRKLGDSTQRRQNARTEALRTYPALLAEIVARRDRRLKEMGEAHQFRVAALAETRARDIDSTRNVTARTHTQRQANERRDRETLARRWFAALSAVSTTVDEINRQSQQTATEWKSMLAAGWSLPEDVPQSIHVGHYEVDLESIPNGIPEDARLAPPQRRFEIPLSLHFPAAGSMLFEASGQGRTVAVESIRAVMLRLLATFPPGKVRFTVIDPVGLGEEFSAFMHMADYDELLIGTRIWTEAAHIEKRLAEVSEHMENVFQAYLRNEFETIEEYNRHAGEVAEPYHFVIVANFPANFTEGAARRLISIASSGPRCGVHALISVDTRQTLPHNFDLADLEAAATTFEWQDGRFISQVPELSLFPVQMDAAPRTGDFAEIVRLVGRQSTNSRRVEVPFERIAPRLDQIWSLDSRSSLEVPLGRAGATKLQYLRLGRGTSQHVLVAGKTGSGKSSLLHTLITNLALNYSPDEVEFFLVDFKKGVEFKTYATGALPHARIIGIESDREFGISVLERLDGILKERGELFRKVGVQDTAGFRSARPTERCPRILLVIDEFQEFFVEDDALSQAAALLLDRLVRQGRAFGIDVLLGSQTLGGAYSLARSTLGQIAVRIALQCSDADAHLILSEENTAARLLKRPGEAIYNDANGLLEGNHPFQVAWLPDQRRDACLEQLHETARLQGFKTEPPIVFEGNVASDPRRNRTLVSEIESFPPAAGAFAAPGLWLGEAVSIKAPTRITFNRRPGDNLLIVGQDTSAQGMLVVAFLTLAAQQSVEPATDASSVPQFCVLDGDALQSQDDTEWKPVVQSVPHRTARSGQRESASLVERIADEVERRADGTVGGERPIFLFVSNLSQLRDLRNEQDDFGFSSSEADKPPSTGKRLADILRDGPAVGVHSLVWCDTSSNLNRWMSSKSLREFEMRVAFQMNASDSSNLIDSPSASKLGGHRAMLYFLETGASEKIRPYAVPSGEWLSWVATQFQKRQSPSQAEPHPQSPTNGKQISPGIV